MPIFDGVKLIVRFYGNFGQLKKVTESTGVPVKRLKRWLDTGKISPRDYKVLVNAEKKNREI